MAVLLDNRKRLLRVRMLMLGLLLLAIAGVPCAVELWQGYGLAPADGGVLRPAAVRLRVAIGVAVLCLLPALGMLLYVQCYAVRIERDRQGLHVTVAGFRRCHTRTVPVQRIRRTSRIEGRLRTWRQTVHAPWINLWIDGDLLPYIVDAQAGRINERGLLALGWTAPAARPPVKASLPASRLSAQVRARPDAGGRRRRRRP